MAGPNITIDQEALEEIQNLKNGLVRQLLGRLGEILAERKPDERGSLRVSLADVQKAVRELLSDPQALAEIERREERSGVATGT